MLVFVRLFVQALYDTLNLHLFGSTHFQSTQRALSKRKHKESESTQCTQGTQKASCFFRDIISCILGLAALLFFLFSSQDSGDTGGSGYGYGYETQDSGYGYGDSYAHSRSVSFPSILI